MTINEYITNPYGKGASYTSISVQKDQLMRDFEALRYNITFKSYKVGTDIVCQLGIPSRKSNKIVYDVVIELPGGMETAPLSFREAEFKAFSNCPSFVYSYAHLFHAQSYLCDWLFDKYPKDVKKEAPGDRNPYLTIGFERSLFLALTYMRVGGWLSTRSLINRCIPNSRKSIKESIRKSDEIEDLYKATVAQQHLVEKKKQSTLKPVTSRTTIKTVAPVAGKASTVKTVRSTKSNKTTSAKKSTRG